MDEAGKVQGVLPIIGALLNRSQTTEELMQPVQSIPATMGVGRAISQVRESGLTMAIVTSPTSAKPIGIVTLKDLVEPLVGELAAR